MNDQNLSQIHPEIPYITGNLAHACRQLKPHRIHISMIGPETSTGPIINPPECTWSIANADRQVNGRLEIHSFIRLWNSHTPNIDGVPLDCDIHNETIIAATRFITLHPSGLPQLVRFDLHDEKFKKQIIYPC